MARLFCWWSPLATLRGYPVKALDSGKTKIMTLTEPVAAELGLEVLDVELGGSASKRVLRIYLDSPDDERGVTLADCETISRRMGDVLDAHEAMAGRYMLEVSSPGVNRPLRKPEHFRKVVGGKVRVRVAQAVDGSQQVLGRLTAFDDDVLTIDPESGESRRIALADVEKANFEYEFEEKTRPGKRRRQGK